MVRSLRFPVRPGTLQQSRIQQDPDIQKSKPQASIKNKIEKFHKLFDVYNPIHKR